MTEIDNKTEQELARICSGRWFFKFPGIGVMSVGSVMAKYWERHPFVRLAHLDEIQEWIDRKHPRNMASNAKYYWRREVNERPFYFICPECFDENGACLDCT